jgi:hypothetical protein
MKGNYWAVNKSPFFKGGFRGITKYNPISPAPLEKRGVKRSSLLPGIIRIIKSRDSAQDDLRHPPD